IKTGKLWVGGICFVFLVGAMFELAQAMGKRNFIFTKMEEGTCKIVLRLGEVYRILWLYSGREKLTQAQAELLNSWLESYRESASQRDIAQLNLSDNASVGEIIEVGLLSDEKALVDDRRITQRDCLERTGQASSLKALVNRVFGVLGGLRLIGIPGIDELHIWRYKEVKIEKESEAPPAEKEDDKGAKPKPSRVVFKEVVGPEEIKNSLRLSDLTVTFLLPSLETSASLAPDSGIGASMDVVVNVGLRVIEPFKATFVIRDWRDALSAIILPFLRQVIGETPPGDVVKSRDHIKQRVLLALKGIRTTWEIDTREERPFIKGVKQYTDDDPLSDEAETNVARLRGRYGLAIIWVEIGEVNASTPEDHDLMNSAYRGAAKSDETERAAVGEAKRYELLMGQLSPNPETRSQVATALLLKEAIEAAGPGSTPVISFGGTTGSGPNATDSATLATLKQISRQLTESAEALKAATKKAAAKEKEA
ncbi:hypothetical protein KJ782_06380, partial [Patescibacteria group bacterium]|nr:hypothetical protein [Patescibacteria group bacterium]